MIDFELCINWQYIQLIVIFWIIKLTLECFWIFSQPDFWYIYNPTHMYEPILSVSLSFITSIFQSCCKNLIKLFWLWSFCVTVFGLPFVICKWSLFSFFYITFSYVYLVKIHFIVNIVDKSWTNNFDFIFVKLKHTFNSSWKPLPVNLL